MKTNPLLTAAIMAMAGIASATTTNEFSLTGNVSIPTNTIGRVTQTSQNAVSYTITIGNGATCILAGVKIATSSSSPITCEGDATIMLEDGTYNEVITSNPSVAGVSAGPAGKTLVIDGGGIIYAESGGHSAGIGGAKSGIVGNITILGGIVSGVAKGGRSNTGYGAGIGSGLAGSCGDIFISGGIVTGMCQSAKDSYGAGIGSAQEANCGRITIAPGANEVVATRGASSRGIPIGGGYESPSVCPIVDKTFSCENIDDYTWKLTPSVTALTVADASELADALAHGSGAMHVTLASGLAATGTFSVVSSVTSLDIDLNGGEIVADGANSPAITMQSTAPVAISGTGAIKGTGTAEAVRTPELVTYGANVDVREADPVVAAAVFPSGGDSIISRFAQKGDGKWGVTAFAELQSGTAEGVDDGQVVVYAADTVGGLTNAAPLASGYEIKSKANAVKVDVEVESDAAAQFFRIGFQNE